MLLITNRSGLRSLYPLLLHFRSASPSISLFPSSRSTSLSLPMAGASENSPAADGEVTDLALKYGFQRSEMYRENLAGTVGAYERHVFLCHKTHDSWPSRLEDSDSDPLPKLLSGALKARKDEIAAKTRLTICEGLTDYNLGDGDVLIFPEMTKYRDLKAEDVNGFVEDVFVNGKKWVAGEPEEITGSYVFVCAHSNRDQRCGVCGPLLIEKFKEEIESRGLVDQVFVIGCSHVGGHKYAGNVIIFGASPDGQITGHWYGYVTPNDVPELLDQHIHNGGVITRLLRGQMGTPTQDSDEGPEQKFPNGNGQNAGEVSQESGNTREYVSGCCQGAKGFSCCQETSLGEIKEKKGLGSPSKWFGKVEHREFVTAAAVVGAVAIVAVAYSFYRKSR